jgi:predicted membrane-bound spermidine synthase
MIYRSVLLPVFFASGFAALIYQIIWQRLLTFITGTDTRSVTIIVASVMAGLGIGSALGGYVADRLPARARLRLFAICELAIATFAFISVPLFYNGLYARFGSHELSLLTAATLHACATAWPMVFMGIAFPLVMRAVPATASSSAQWVAAMYGANTLGAACGALCTVTLLLPALDFAAIVRIGAALNLACAVTALAVSRRAPEDAPSAAAAAERPPSGASLAWWMALFALSGFVALALEIVWFRILAVILRSDAGAFGRLLAIYLGGLGLGAAASQLTIVKRWPAATSFLLLQAAIPIYSAGAIAVFAAAPAEHVIWSLLPFELMLVPTFLMGLSFGSIQRAVQTDLAVLGRRVGWLQFANVAGSVAGALATGLWLIDQIGAMGIMRLVAAAGGLFLILALRGADAKLPARRLVGAAALALLVMIAVPDRANIWSRLHRAEVASTIVRSDSSGVAVLKKNEGSTLLLVNGRGQSELPYGGVQTDLGLVPTMLHPHPARVAIIGLGSGNTTFSAGGRPETLRIDTIEIVQPVFGALEQFDQQHAYPPLHQLLRDGRMRYRFRDGRAYLSKARQRYDVIEADALRANSAYAGNIYSVQYFALLRSRLKPGGYAVTWLPTTRVRESLREAFPYVQVWDELAIGSERPIVIDPEVIRSRLALPFTRDYFAAAGIDAGAIMETYLQQRPELFTPSHERPRRSDLDLDLFPRDEFQLQD